MNRKQIENLYFVNGLSNFQLKTHQDLLRVHGIDYRDVAGYAGLDDLDKQLYEKFILNIFNSWGLDARSTLVPTGIFFVEQTDYLGKEYPEDDSYIVLGGKVELIDKFGNKIIIREWKDSDYQNLKISEKETSTYLRFEYEYGDDGRKEWLHVVKENDWY